MCWPVCEFLQVGCVFVSPLLSLGHGISVQVTHEGDTVILLGRFSSSPVFSVPRVVCY